MLARTATLARLTTALVVLVGCRDLLGIDERTTRPDGDVASTAAASVGGGGATVSSTASASGGAGGGGADAGSGGACSMAVFALEPLPECATCLRENCCDAVDACGADPGCVACTHAEDGCDFPPSYAALKECVQGGACGDECYPEPAVAQEPGYCDGADLDFGPAMGACGYVDGVAWCNPIRQSSTCSFGLGLACDFDQREPRPNTATRFSCFISPQSRHVCSDCGVVEGPCHFGLTCANYKCMRFCCDDADCGGDRCDTAWVEYRFQGDPPPGLGVCVR